MPPGIYSRLWTFHVKSVSEIRGHRPFEVFACVPGSLRILNVFVFISMKYNTNRFAHVWNRLDDSYLADLAALFQSLPLWLRLCGTPQRCIRGLTRKAEQWMNDMFMSSGWQHRPLDCLWSQWKVMGEQGFGHVGVLQRATCKPTTILMLATVI